MEIRDRVRELRRVPASQLRPNARNWRTHPDRQRDALRGVLAEIGYAGALLARELDDGSLELIDGHLRAETTPEAEVPVLILDVTEQEANKLLAVVDPLAAMAETNHERLRSLVDDVETQSEALRALLDEMTADARNSRATLSDVAASQPLVASYQVVVECADEAQQKLLCERLDREGFRCRLLVL